MNQIEQTITTLEIAEMMGMRHDRVLRKLEGQDVRGKHTEGIIEILTHHNLGASDYFIPSTYKDESGKENKCYKVTKLGCDFLANKFNGEKGIVFTARYVKRFTDMEKAIKKPQAALPKNDDLFADCYISKQQLDASRGAWFRKNNWKLKIIMEQFGWTRKFLYHKILVELSDIYDLELEEKFYVRRFGYRPEYKLDLLDGSKSLARLATGYINYLLTEEGDY
jgi:Rha family phage regulatory protein